MKSEEIKSFWIRYDDDDNTYTVEIETDSFCINYPKANVIFSCSDNMAFPVSISILDKNGHVSNEFSLIKDN